MPDGYCEPDDVREALQETDLSGPINATIVTSAITGVTQWFRRRARTHVYDSGGGTTLIPTEAATTSTVSLDVPSSPHTQDRQLFRSESGVRYPVTRAGPYAKIRLPHRDVSSLTTLEVRDRDGGVTDWTAESDKAEGRGEDYYVQADDADGYGRTYLYLRAASIGPRTDYEELLTVGYEYGRDAANEGIDDITTGIANLAAAEVVEDDGVIAQIPDNARLVNVSTEYQHYLDLADRLLGPYLTARVA